MTVESEALSRSKLEQKDRSELAAIVDAMGGKATSRAKKADLVDLVLRLAGATPDTDTTSSSAPAPAPAATPARNGRNGKDKAKAESADSEAVVPTAEAAEATASAEVEAPPAEAAQPAESAAEPTADSSPQVAADEEPPAEWELAIADSEVIEPEATSADAAATESQASGDGAPRPQRGEQGRQGGQGGQGQGRQQGGGQQGRQGGQGQGGQGGQGQGGQGGQGEEQGNRRRRRRGRDRNRDQQGGQGGQGQERQGQERQGQGQPEEPFVGEPVDVEGFLDLRDEGYGFLRLKGFVPSKDDVYVSVKQVRQFGLRKGDYLKGAGRPASRNEKNPALLRIDLVNGADPEQAKARRRFEDLTPLFPDEKLKLEMADDPTNMTARIIDLIAPIGKGQRGMIVSPPKAGKTTVMKHIARSIELNNPEVHLIVLLVDERPEEVTDFKRWLLRGEVAASTFDRPSDEHTVLSELVIERAKRMVEMGRDVVIILDGITRLARAYNLAQPATGRIMSGGIDAGALYPPKKFFGAARNVEEGGSLTIIATALVETNSRMDEHIFEEFKATGNMELKLDRKMAERRIYPAIDVDASSTRHEELLFARNQLNQVWKLRRVLSGLSGGGEGGSGGAGLELLIDRMRTFKSNDEFLAEIAKAPSISG